MSKATEYARLVLAAGEAQPDAWVDGRKANGKPGPYLRLDVETDGNCRVYENSDYLMTLPVGEAISMARWILDTFSDGELLGATGDGA